jgi:hypothetical protein
MSWKLALGLMVDTRNTGRVLVAVPKVKTHLDDDGVLIPELLEDGEETAVWETYKGNFEQVDVFTARFIKMLNLVQTARGWAGGLSDLANATTYPLVALFRRYS